MKRILLILLFLVAAGLAVIAGMEWRNELASREQAPPVADAAQQIARGAYLARAGDCMACHTTRGGAPFAGGRTIQTPFGSIVSSNITPDPEHGIGSWTADDFWRAIHNGRSKDGKFLYPAFPYPNYTKVTRADADALFAYLRTVTPAAQPSQEHALRFPFNQRILLAAWRTLYFKPGTYQPQASQSAEWNRGAYLVQGLGHCNACHTNRNVLGATETSGDLAGGLIPMLNWYAPSLTSDAEAGLGGWEVQHIVQLLKTGVSPRSTVFGPMAEVVRESLQHLDESDIRAMAVYLKSLPQGDPPVKPDTGRLSPAESERVLKLGGELYEKHCAECHKSDGKGAPPAYPPLAGNRTVSTPLATNPIRIVLNGGFPPSTGGNPRPYGMPPFSQALNDAEVAAVVSYIRSAWGNRADPVTTFEVTRYRSVPAD
ncbi:c-type cytochrome [Noviherbaspirillum massiliense]|uniref:c-type cytochrome n=1 Tax=Noviherbaspirillum massiliense TaxID=1465823 RepID=UPI0002E9140F|nr:cytochrome c [Noviherbaspirillum massiliense]